MAKNAVLRQAFSNLDIAKKNKEHYIPAILGFYINNLKTVEVTARPGYVYARIRSNTTEVVQAYNDKVSPVYDLPVLLLRDPNNPSRYKIEGRDTARYENWGTASSFLPRHGNQHSFNPDTGGGGDIVWVYGKQFIPLSLSPSGTAGGPNVLINGYSYYQNFNWKYAGGTGTASLLPYKPTGSNARMVLVYLDDYGNPSLSPGSYLNENITGTSSILSYLPTVPTTTSIPIGAIRLVSGTTTIGWNNIYDLRPLIVGDGFTPTGSFGHTIQDDGTPFASRDALNFVGNGFVVYDSAGATVVSGTQSVSGASTPTYPALYDDLVFKGTGISMNFGDNLSLIFSGTTAFITATDTNTQTPTYPAIYGNSVFKATGTSISFNDNLSVIASGSSVFINATAGGGGSNLLIYDDSVFKATGTSISFNDNLNVVVTGTSVFIDSVDANVPIMTLFNYEGELYVLTGTARIYNRFGINLTFSEVFLSVNTAPTGSSILVDVNVNGSSIFTAGNRPAILAGSLIGSSAIFNTSVWVSGTYLTTDIDQIGSSIPGNDLVVHIVAQ